MSAETSNGASVPTTDETPVPTSVILGRVFPLSPGGTVYGSEAKASHLTSPKPLAPGNGDMLSIDKAGARVDSIRQVFGR